LSYVSELCLAGDFAATVFVIDPAPEATLRANAPGLWDVLHRERIIFTHVPVYGEQFLSEFRDIYSRWYLSRLLYLGKEVYEAVSGNQCAEATLSADDVPKEALYQARLEAEGKRIGRPARKRVPDPNCENFAVFMLALRHSGAQPEGPFYRLGDQLVRVVNGAGRPLSKVQEEFAGEAGALLQADIVVCVDAVDYGLPGNIVRGPGKATLIRSAPRGQWLTGEAARALVGL
jgi:hypothetical protein